MTIPAFDEKELEVKGQVFTRFGPVPLLNYPVSIRDAYVSAVRDCKPIPDFIVSYTQIAIQENSKQTRKNTAETQLSLCRV